MTVPASPQSTGRRRRAGPVVRADGHVLAVHVDGNAEGAQGVDHQRGVAGGGSAGDGGRAAGERREQQGAVGHRLRAGHGDAAADRVVGEGRGPGRAHRTPSLPRSAIGIAVQPGSSLRSLTPHRPRWTAGPQPGAGVSPPFRGVGDCSKVALLQSDCSKATMLQSPRCLGPAPTGGAHRVNCRWGVPRWTHVRSLLLDEGAQGPGRRVPGRRRDGRGEGRRLQRRAHQAGRRGRRAAPARRGGHARPGAASSARCGWCAGGWCRRGRRTRRAAPG